jgi:hypothetical protein
LAALDAHGNRGPKGSRIAGVKPPPPRLRFTVRGGERPFVARQTHKKQKAEADPDGASRATKRRRISGSAASPAASASAAAAGPNPTPSLLALPRLKPITAAPVMPAMVSASPFLYAAAQPQPQQPAAVSASGSGSCSAGSALAPRFGSVMNASPPSAVQQLPAAENESIVTLLPLPLSPLSPSSVFIDRSELDEKFAPAPLPGASAASAPLPSAERLLPSAGSGLEVPLNSQPCSPSMDHGLSPSSNASSPAPSAAEVTDGSDSDSGADQSLPDLILDTDSLSVLTPTPRLNLSGNNCPAP